MSATVCNSTPLEDYQFTIAEPDSQQAQHLNSILTTKRTYLGLPVRLTGDLPSLASRSLTLLKQTMDRHNFPYQDQKIIDLFNKGTFHITVCYGGFTQGFEPAYQYMQKWFTENQVDDLVMGPLKTMDCTNSTIGRHFVALVGMESAKLDQLRSQLIEQCLIDPTKSQMHPFHVTLFKYIPQ